MLTSTLRAHLDDTLTAFAWEEWAQMGILATAGPPRPWAQDPEALILFTFEVARSDPRLFDEVLDWLVSNEQLISLRRLKALATDPEDVSLSDAVLAWLGGQRPKARFSSATKTRSENTLEPLFFDESFPITQRDEAFAAHGWLRPAFSGTSKSRPPDLQALINLSFRLRNLLGVSARAEIVRLLLTMQESTATAARLARSAGYTKRNVHEALSSLDQAGAITSFIEGNELRYSIDRDRWSAFLSLAQPIMYVEWPRLLLTLRRMLRWARSTSDADLSDYMLSSSARDLLEQIRPDLEAAGIHVPRGTRSVTALDDLAVLINDVSDLLHEPTKVKPGHLEPAAR